MKTQLTYVKKRWDIYHTSAYSLVKITTIILARGTEGRIDAGTGPQIWVVPTDEEGRIAKETRQVI